MSDNLSNRKMDESQRRKPLGIQGNVILFILVPMIFLILFPVPILILASMPAYPGGSPVVPIAIWYAITLPLGGWGIRECLRTVRDRDIMNRGSGRTTATILDRQARTKRGPYGNSTTYYVTFEFTPMVAESSNGPLTLHAEVSEKIYDSLAPGATATVTYATGDPRIVLFEGE